MREMNVDIPMGYTNLSGNRLRESVQTKKSGFSATAERVFFFSDVLTTGAQRSPQPKARLHRIQFFLFDVLRLTCMNTLRTLKGQVLKNGSLPGVTPVRMPE